MNGFTRGARYLITGGAGFIGTNVADRLLTAGNEVVVFDDLSRAGVEHNLQWLLDKHRSGVKFEHGDVRDGLHLQRVVPGSTAVFHFAAQVAVTTSLVDPKKDFEINAGGTLNVLEAIRLSGERIPLLFTSTNKVYGHLEHVALERMDRRYVPVDSSVRFQGIDERTPLSFHSPYGCSKGAADQYVCDYARCFGIPTCVFRMSCIYGPHQFGTEDQGWVAHFLLRALAHERLTLFGDGMQVRDILYVDDLVEAFLAALSHMDKVKGGAFNMGGGPTNTVSLLELLRLIAARTGRRPDVAVENWRVGDQRYYVSNTRRFELLTGWRARVSVEEGIRRLHDWLLKFSPLLQIAKTLEAGLHPVLHGGAH